MNKENIGFGIFCFGDDYYYQGAYNKIKQIIEHGYKCFILTEKPEEFQGIYKTLKIIPYYRTFKSYHDKMILPKHILKECDIAILLDADLDITDYSFLDDLRRYNFKKGITYIDVLLNHPEAKENVKELNLYSLEWDEYRIYCEKIYPQFLDLHLMWEYFLVINKNGFNSEFYYHYDKLQIKRESCYINIEQDVYAPGEGISISISAKLSNTNIQRDEFLYNTLKNKMNSISRRFSG